MDLLAYEKNTKMASNMSHSRVGIVHKLHRAV